MVGNAIQAAIFALATVFHFVRTYSDIFDRNSQSCSRWSLTWATIGFVFYATTLGLGAWMRGNDEKDVKSNELLAAIRFVAPAGCWAFKASIAVLLPRLRVRRIVFRVVATFLAASFLALVLVHLLVCKPWIQRAEGEFKHRVEVTSVNTALNVSGYLLVMTVPIACWSFVSQHFAALTMEFLGTGLCAFSIAHCAFTLKAGRDLHTAYLPEMFVDAELALGLITVSLPSLYLHFHQASNTREEEVTPVSQGGSMMGTSDMAKRHPPETGNSEARELISLGMGLTFDPRHLMGFNSASLGVLPDSMPGSLRSEVSTPNAPVGPEDWQAESNRAVLFTDSTPNPNAPPTPSLAVWEPDELERCKSIP